MFYAVGPIRQVVAIYRVRNSVFFLGGGDFKCHRQVTANDRWQLPKTGLTVYFIFN